MPKANFKQVPWAAGNLALRITHFFIAVVGMLRKKNHLSKVKTILKIRVYSDFSPDKNQDMNLTGKCPNFGQSVRTLDRGSELP